MGTLSVAVGTQAAAHPTSEVSSRVPGSTQVYAHPLGTVAKDESGNEFVYVEYGAQVYTGVWVRITPDYTACIPLAAIAAGTNTGEHGPVGIAMAAGASDTAGWVQVRGTMSVAQDASGGSARTSSFALVVNSSVSTPAVGAATQSLLMASDPGHYIHNAWITGVETTSPASGASFVGSSVPVRLNYPYITGQTTHHSS